VATSGPHGDTETAGYSEEEKVEIAKRYLIPRQLQQSGLKPEECTITDDSLKIIISGYTARRCAPARAINQQTDAESCAEICGRQPAVSDNCG